MIADENIPLIIGEIFVDVTVLAASGAENKLRLGGVVHAARALWATNTSYAVAAFLPDYLNDSAEAYLARFGCSEFIRLGTVEGAPNVILVFDPTEVGYQGYETLLRDEKTIVQTATAGCTDFTRFDPILIFPGAYDLTSVAALLPGQSNLIVDAAYDIETVEQLAGLSGKIDSIVISTSSDLFRQEFDGDFVSFANKFSGLSPRAVILKENRGGCRAYVSESGSIVRVPAYLGETVNSIGVGDAFDAVFAAYQKHDRVEAVWRGAQVASCYAQTTEPDLFKEYVRRELALSMDELTALPGSLLPWEDRPKHHIYLAAPDFSAFDRTEIDRVLAALTYHNFVVRRPVQENGEVPPHSGWSTLNSTYHKDVALLRGCDLIFAMPIGRDPGTLVEMGMAIAAEIPVVAYDPRSECQNTMVMAGRGCTRNLWTSASTRFSMH